ncbi:MAG TPA: NUDIX domain-containing protein [bacterium]|nr:NUDIX domain-containing protein [bacterium]HOQ91532.1 NUDIX domain-containing protein [bacterium]HPL22174.1 NUDIX domain-containing protein [bacterium]HPW44631.1 NUDIX domain-containing protein [bacterium]HPX64197.1 NUDIX domain-containing protein [bacterium]
MLDKLKELDLITPSILPMPKGVVWSWQLYINGEPVDMSFVQHIAIKSRFGTVNFGADERAGYNSVAFEEAGRGGAVIVPFFCLKDGQVVAPNQLYDELYIGVVEQYRNKQGGMVLNVPRGFVKQGGEPHEAAAKREIFEETGLIAEPFLLPGHNLNPNSAFFETGEDGGCRIYAIVLSPEQVAIDDDGIHLITDNIPEDSREIIGKCRFIPAHEVSQLGDMFSVAAESRLINYLISLDTN